MRRAGRFGWEGPRWPHFRWDAGHLLVPLGAARGAQGELRGLLAYLGFRDLARAELDARTEEALQTADIEGEAVSRVAVRSSIARRLNIDEGAAVTADAKAQGLVDMILDATIDYASPLTIERLNRWHAGLFPVPLGGAQSRIAIGRWRDDATGPMQVVSGRIDEPTIHFQAPPATRIQAEVEAFLHWFEAPASEDGLLRSAIAHLWFVTIHPYDDGNGRIARAISDMALARDENSSRRYFSMSRQINIEKANYYDAIEHAQRSNLDITDWLTWFLGCYKRAIESARRITDEVLKAQDFWRKHEDVAISDRQRRVLTRYLHGFEGKLTARKWAAMAKASPDTAQRDIADLVDKGVLAKNAGGSKNTSYSVVGYDLS